MGGFATRADLDALIQTLQSNPGEKGRPYFRGVPVVVQRDYVASGTPATFAFQQVWSYQGSGGMLYPDRQLEANLVVAAYNGSGSHRWVQTELRLNTAVLASANIFVQNTATYEGDLSYRLIALGSNSAQLLAGSARAGVAENLADPWTLSLHVRWRDATGIDFVIDPDNLTEPVADTYYFRFHALAVLT